MSLKSFRSIPADIIEWARYFSSVIVKPDPNTVTNETFANRSANSIIGRPQADTGTPSDIIASADHQVLIRRGSALTFGVLDLTDLPDTLTTDAELATEATTLTNAYTAADAVVTAAYIAADAALVAAKFLTGTYAGGFTGCTTDPAPTIRYSASGSVVVLQLPSTTATSNATTFTLTGAPAAIRPARSQTLLCRTQDSGTTQLSIATLDTAGVITFGYGVTGAVYTNTGTKGFSAASLTYSLD
jgi:hypothetical protein